MNKPQPINAVDVIRRSFRHLDSRLISHGERVAYILMKMLEETRRYTIKEKHDIFMLGLLHDIGAYKDSEIDSMLSFDTDESMEHSVFGYLLFKTFSPLPQYSDVILYHHRGNAQYYSVPISSYHRDIAKLIYLADRIDVFCVQNPEGNLASFLEEHSGRTFFPADIRWFWGAQEKHQILEHIKSMDYQEEVTEYIQQNSKLMTDQTKKYLLTLTFSIDFRSEYTALHTDYAVHLSKNIARALHQPTHTCELIAAAALLHNIGKVSLGNPFSVTEDYEGYLKTLYNDSTLEATKQILTENVDIEILHLIEESYYLLKCWTTREPVTDKPAIAAEIVALSYLMSNSLSVEMNVSYCHHPRLQAYLRETYRNCGMNDKIFKTLEKSFDEIIEKTQTSCSAIYDTYHHMMEEYRSLNIILQHYNNKY
ncbi:MAG: HD domain-containing protein [Lachnospiraceae bacterium]|nr:HD domain-containing protein [Lachnospiraceae bacterium]